MSTSPSKKDPDKKKKEPQEKTQRKSAGKTEESSKNVVKKGDKKGDKKSEDSAPKKITKKLAESVPEKTEPKAESKADTTEKKKKAAPKKIADNDDSEPGIADSEETQPGKPKKKSSKENTAERKWLSVSEREDKYEKTIRPILKKKSEDLDKSGEDKIYEWVSNPILFESASGNVVDVMTPIVTADFGTIGAAEKVKKICEGKGYQCILEVVETVHSRNINCEMYREKIIRGLSSVEIKLCVHLPTYTDTIHIKEGIRKTDCYHCVR